MAKERIRLKEYEDLTFSDDFIFGKMMEDPELCRKVLETLLQRPVGELQNVVTQKMLKQTKDGKKIHLLTKELLGGVEKARHNEEWKTEYMKELLHDDDMIQEGIAIGREEGKEKTILSLVKDGLLQEDVAASKLKISIEELQQKLKETED